MNYAIRRLIVTDEPIVWEMLRHAAHEPSLAAVYRQPYLTRYVSGWGRVGDIGWVADQDNLPNHVPIGAAWLRLWPGEEKGFGHVSDTIPELAMAVLPNYRGQGIGSHLLEKTLEIAKEDFAAVSLNVRADNAAVRLYERAGFIKISGSERGNRVGGASFNMIYKF